jgi:acetyl esterase/lipase
LQILKYIIVISIFVIAVISGAHAYFARDIRPTHTSLAGDNLLPMIPVRDFFADHSAEWGYQPSFDGSMLAWYATEWGSAVVHLERVDGTGPKTTLAGADFQFFHWHPARNDLLIGVEGRLWQVDPARPGREDWQDITPRGFQNWRLISLPYGPEDRLVIGSNDRNPALHDLYTVRQDGGGKTLLKQNNGKTINWWLDDDANILIKAERLEDGGAHYQIRNNPEDEWRTLTQSSPEDIFEILNAPSKDSPIYALSDRGRDRVAFVRIDPETGEEHIVADHPRVDARMPVSLSRRVGKWDFLMFHDGYPTLQALTPRGESLANFVLDGDHPVDFKVLGASLDGRFVTVARSWREQSFEYFLYDLKKSEATRLDQNSFHRHKNSLSETVPVSFKARDGLEISGLLMLPGGVEPRNLPTIVVIHGGPAQHDVWGYNNDFQFLANRGYAVLSVNFRGSTGNGKMFRAAGYGEVGKAMQDDIVDAAKWLVAEGIADEANMAVMGGSYGGYSAALAMTRDPGLFKAAIIDYGMMDVAYQMQNNPFSWGLHLDEFKRYFGDPENEAHLAEMRDRSPLTHAGKVTGAILLTAGKDDRTVGFEQSEEFERALRAADKNVTAVYFDKENHGYRRWQTKVQRARLIEDFLAEHLGGRSGGFDYVELAAKYFN